MWFVCSVVGEGKWGGGGGRDPKGIIRYSVERRERLSEWRSSPCFEAVLVAVGTGSGRTRESNGGLLRNTSEHASGAPSLTARYFYREAVGHVEPKRRSDDRVR